MYINLHTKSHIFLKIVIFCKVIITFSGSAYLMKNSTFLSKFHFFFLHKINIFAPKLILTETLVILPQSLHHIVLSLDLEIHSFARKTDAFCIKILLFTKRKQRHQKLTLSKPEDISSRKLNISIKNWHFWKWWPFATKMKKNPSKLVFLQDFRFYQ